ncbi:MAG: SDR family NAD(P)-dependent oxidoreductase, partial [Pseudomonadales bacterium]
MSKHETLSKYFDLTGKVVVITGGSRGLGLEMSAAFAAVGARVVIASR